MKTLKWSSIALVLLCIFSACTKSSTTIDQEAQQLRLDRPNNVTGNDDVPPAIVVNFNPDPAILNEAMTVTGTFADPTVSGVAVPDCGKLQLFQKIDGQWVMVKQEDVTSTVHGVSIPFTPTIAGNDVYEFKVHYVASGNCKGFSQVFSGSFFLDVINPCTGLSIKGSATAVPSVEAGKYDFTVRYVVNTCGIEYTHLKTQGGLTAWTTDVQNGTPSYYESWQVGNSPHPNSIIKWEEWSPLAGNTITYSITFRKAWSGSGPVALTGAWSVKADFNGSEVATASCDPIVYQ